MNPNNYKIYITIASSFNGTCNSLVKFMNNTLFG
jgi:hypothetical protein